MECQKSFHVNCFMYSHHCWDYPPDFVPDGTDIVEKLDKHFKEQAVSGTQTWVSKHTLLNYCNIKLPTIKGKACIVSKAKQALTTTMTTEAVATATTAAAEGTTTTITTTNMAGQGLRDNNPAMITARALNLERQDCVLTRQMRENIINKTAAASCILTRSQQKKKQTTCMLSL